MKRKLLNLLSDIKKQHVMVIGDIMFDRYIMGSVSRLSPEAPVPVVDVKDESFVPGGAANTANNIASLSGTCYLVGVVGNDEPKKLLLELFKKNKINTEGIFTDPARPTIQKLRVIGSKQQLVRVDYENRDTISKEIQSNILDFVKKKVEKLNVIVFSDYAKGTLSRELVKRVIAIAKKHNIKTIVDPKPQNKDFYKGATLLTPNIKEATEMTGINGTTEDDIYKIGHAIQNMLGTQVLITRGDLGISLIEKNKLTTIPTQAKEVYDVSGAGDTVVAVIALSMAAGASLREAAVIANQAAGIVVAKVGTATVTIDEIEDVFEKRYGKLKTLEQLIDIVSDLKKKGKKIVWTNGCFDILHVGHARYLQEARRMGDILILGLNTDDSIKRIKGEGRPIMNQEDRAEMLSALACVDYIIFFDDDTPKRCIDKLVPDVVVKGGDYKREEVVGHKLMDKTGGKVVLIPLIEGKSTTGIINKIVENHTK